MPKPAVEVFLELDPQLPGDKFVVDIELANVADEGFAVLNRDSGTSPIENLLRELLDRHADPGGAIVSLGPGDRPCRGAQVCFHNVAHPCERTHLLTVTVMPCVKAAATAETSDQLTEWREF